METTVAITRIIETGHSRIEQISSANWHNVSVGRAVVVIPSIKIYNVKRNRCVAWYDNIFRQADQETGLLSL